MSRQAPLYNSRSSVSVTVRERPHLTSPHLQSNKDFLFTGRTFNQIYHCWPPSDRVEFHHFLLSSSRAPTNVGPESRRKPAAAMNQRSFSLLEVPLKSDQRKLCTKLNITHITFLLKIWSLIWSSILASTVAIMKVADRPGDISILTHIYVSDNRTVTGGLWPVKWI